MLYRCNKMGGNSWINSFHKNWIFKHNIMQINIQTNKREGRGGNKKQKNKNRTENQIKNATHGRQFSVFNKLKVHPLFKWPIKENIQYWRTHSVWNEILLSLLGLQAQQQCREGDNKSLLLFYPKGAINWQRMHLKEFQISSFSSSSFVYKNEALSLHLHDWSEVVSFTLLTNDIVRIYFIFKPICCPVVK